MQTEFHEISAKEWQGNPFTMIGSQWMLVTAGKPDAYNTMTASWGGVGVLWGKDVTFTFIRPTRYTYEFMEREELYSLSFFEESYRKQLNLCGTKSGRDTDKAKECGFEVTFDFGAPVFRQASAALICRKLYAQNIDPALFVDDSLDRKWYQNDYHKLYIGSIETVLVR